MRRCLLALVSSLVATSAVAQAPVRRPATAASAAKAPAASKARAAATAKPAATVHLARSDVSLDLPKGWTSEANAGATEAYTLLSPDGVTTLMLFAVPATDTQAGLADLETTLKGVVTDPTLAAPNKGEVGGMPALMADGTGKVDGHDVELGLLLVFNEAKQRVVFLIGFTLPDRGDAYAKDVAAILHSVRTGR